MARMPIRPPSPQAMPSVQSGAAGPRAVNAGSAHVVTPTIEVKKVLTGAASRHRTPALTSAHRHRRTLLGFIAKPARDAFHIVTTSLPVVCRRTK